MFGAQLEHVQRWSAVQGDCQTEHIIANEMCFATRHSLYCEALPPALVCLPVEDMSNCPASWTNGQARPVTVQNGGSARGRGVSTPLSPGARHSQQQRSSVSIRLILTLLRWADA